MDEPSLEGNYQSTFDFQTIEEIDLYDNLVDFEKIDDEYDSDEAEGSFNEGEQQNNEGEQQNIDSTLIPYEGMEFSNDDIAYEFYKYFAVKKGFSTRKYSSYKSRSDGTVIKRTFVCNKEGFRRFDKREEGREVKHRRVTRENCQAHMIVQRTPKGHWCITRFSDTHSHAMIFSPQKKARLRSNKKASEEPHNKAAMDDFHSCGIGPAQIARLINVGSHSASKITPQQVYSYLRTSRKNNMGKECMIVLNKLMEKQAQDSQFYYAVEVDENQVCRSIFWADGRARNAYMLFSDVVVFDVTYRTNNFSLPFAPFTGVNHHWQSTLFGCALLADEREETFIWLFENWLKCMWNKAHAAIITDQDTAIRNAIKIVFPKTHHRFCKWHLDLHVDEHLRSLRSSYNPDFDEDYQKWTRNRDINESEQAWLKLQEKYIHCFEEPLTEKQKNEIKSWRWLKNMHGQRKHWVRAYLQKTFFAGMKTSQRSESINAFFDGFVHSSTPLSEFIDQYDNAVADRCDKEEYQDFICMTTKPDLTKSTPLEYHAGQVYTKNVFNKFKEEFECVFHCRHKKLKKDGDMSTYQVTCNYDNKAVSHVVIVIREASFECSCAKFENAGLLCKHILYLMKQKFDFTSIPERYILQRWTLSARYTTSGKVDRILEESQKHLRTDEVTALEAWNFRTYMDRLFDRVVRRREFLVEATICLGDLSEKLDLIEGEQSSKFTEVRNEVSHVSDISQITIRDPSKCATKGRPKVARRILSGKQASQIQAKPRVCRKCNGAGHDSRNCRS